MIDFQYFKTDKIKLDGNKTLGELVYIFCNDDYLLEKNIKYLNHNTLTDVITFDYCLDKIISGDILISVERVRENSESYNVSFSEELNRVMVHGLLHLLKYNDKTKKQSKIMREKEDFYLQNKSR
jgi:probable rRNA maturation factor